MLSFNFKIEVYLKGLFLEDKCEHIFLVLIAMAYGIFVKNGLHVQANGMNVIMENGIPGYDMALHGKHVVLYEKR